MCQRASLIVGGFYALATFEDHMMTGNGLVTMRTDGDFIVSWLVSVLRHGNILRSHQDGHRLPALRNEVSL